MHSANCILRTGLTQLALLAAIVVAGCSQDFARQEDAFVLQPGDLLLQDLDAGPLCDAIEKVTTGYRGAKFSHVGIVAGNENGDLLVIEATGSGVGVNTLGAFMGRSLDATGRPKVVVGRLSQEYQHLIVPALEQGMLLVGKPYDRVFRIDNDAYYCSELVHEIFLRANGRKPVFELQPMTFKDPGTGGTLATWQEYFSKLATAIPEGEPGINPGGISRSPVLTIVHAYSVPKEWLVAEPTSK